MQRDVYAWFDPFEDIDRADMAYRDGFRDGEQATRHELDRSLEGQFKLRLADSVQVLAARAAREHVWAGAELCLEAMRKCADAMEASAKLNLHDRWETAGRPRATLDYIVQGPYRIAIDLPVRWRF